MTKEQFRLFKQRLYQTQNSLKNSLESCPDLAGKYIELPDGHRLYPNEIFSWIEAVRADCWRYGPADVEKRHIKSILDKQPRG